MVVAECRKGAAWGDWTADVLRVVPWLSKRCRKVASGEVQRCFALQAQACAEEEEEDGQRRSSRRFPAQHATASR
jgi:hypothetical protein